MKCVIVKLLSAVAPRIIGVVFLASSLCSRSSSSNYLVHGAATLGLDRQDEKIVAPNLGPVSSSSSSLFFEIDDVGVSQAVEAGDEEIDTSITFETEIETETNTETETEIKTETDTESDTETKTETEIKNETQTDADTETEVVIADKGQQDTRLERSHEEDKNKGFPIFPNDFVIDLSLMPKIDAPRSMPSTEYSVTRPTHSIRPRSPLSLEPKKDAVKSLSSVESAVVNNDSYFSEDAILEVRSTSASSSSGTVLEHEKLQDMKTLNNMQPVNRGTHHVSSEEQFELSSNIMSSMFSQVGNGDFDGKGSKRLLQDNTFSPADNEPLTISALTPQPLIDAVEDISQRIFSSYTQEFHEQLKENEIFQVIEKFYEDHENYIEQFIEPFDRFLNMLDPADADNEENAGFYDVIDFFLQSKLDAVTNQLGLNQCPAEPSDIEQRFLQQELNVFDILSTFDIEPPLNKVENACTLLYGLGYVMNTLSPLSPLPIFNGKSEEFPPDNFFGGLRNRKDCGAIALTVDVVSVTGNLRFPKAQREVDVEIVPGTFDLNWLLPKNYNKDFVREGNSDGYFKLTFGAGVNVSVDKSKPCSTGEYYTDEEKCSPCVQGYTCDGSEAKLCPRGFYCEEKTSSIGVPCDGNSCLRLPGNYVLPGRTYRSVCEPGGKRITTSKLRVEICPPSCGMKGQYLFVPQDGSPPQCTDCPAGYECPENDSFPKLCRSGFVCKEGIAPRECEQRRCLGIGYTEKDKSTFSVCCEGHEDLRTIIEGQCNPVGQSCTCMKNSCQCPPRHYYDATAKKCDICKRGYLCPQLGGTNEEIQLCPRGKFCKGGTNGPTDCETCDSPGFYGRPVGTTRNNICCDEKNGIIDDRIPGIPKGGCENENLCSPCPKNARKLKDECVCNQGYHWKNRNTQEEECVKCEDGYNCPGDGGLDVQLCPAKHTCNGGISTSCPNCPPDGQGMTIINGRSPSSICCKFFTYGIENQIADPLGKCNRNSCPRCLGNTYRVNGACVPCKKGYTCPSSDSDTLLKNNIYEDPEIKLCEIGFYCGGNGEANQGPRPCKVNDPEKTCGERGQYLPDGWSGSFTNEDPFPSVCDSDSDVITFAEVCPAQEPCPANSKRLGSLGCICEQGYYKDSKTQKCVKCEDGYNCPGNGIINIDLCPAKQTCNGGISTPCPNCPSDGQGMTTINGRSPFSICCKFFTYGSEIRNADPLGKCNMYSCPRCLVNEYRVNGACVPCKKGYTCPSPNYAPPPKNNIYEDPEIKLCEIGFYCGGNGEANQGPRPCRVNDPEKTCGEKGQYLPDGWSGPSPEEDPFPSVCDSDSDVITSAEMCPPCPANSKMLGSLGCICEQGYYKNSKTQKCCKCEDGYNCPGDGVIDVQLCPAKHTCNGGISTSCPNCPPDGQGMTIINGRSPSSICCKFFTYGIENQIADPLGKCNRNSCPRCLGNTYRVNGACVPCKKGYTCPSSDSDTLLKNNIYEDPKPKLCEIGFYCGGNGEANQGPKLCNVNDPNRSAQSICDINGHYLPDGWSGSFTNEDPFPSICRLGGELIEFAEECTREAEAPNGRTFSYKHSFEQDFRSETTSKDPLRISRRFPGIGLKFYFPGIAGDTNGWGGLDIGISSGDNCLTGITLHIGTTWPRCRNDECKIKTRLDVLLTGLYVGGFTINFATAGCITEKKIADHIKEAFGRVEKISFDSFGGGLAFGLLTTEKKTAWNIDGKCTRDKYIDCNFEENIPWDGSIPQTEAFNCPDTTANCKPTSAPTKKPTNSPTKKLTNAPTASTPAPTASTPTPTASTPTPTASTPAPTASTPTPTVSTPTPKASTPTPTASTPASTALSSPEKQRNLVKVGKKVERGGEEEQILTRSKETLSFLREGNNYDMITEYSLTQNQDNRSKLTTEKYHNYKEEDYRKLQDSGSDLQPIMETLQTIFLNNSLVTDYCFGDCNPSDSDPNRQVKGRVGLGKAGKCDGISITLTSKAVTVKNTAYVLAKTIDQNLADGLSLVLDWLGPFGDFGVNNATLNIAATVPEDSAPGLELNIIGTPKFPDLPSNPPQIGKIFYNFFSKVNLALSGRLTSSSIVVMLSASSPPISLDEENNNVSLESRPTAIKPTPTGPGIYFMYERTPLSPAIGDQILQLGLDATLKICYENCDSQNQNSKKFIYLSGQIYAETVFSPDIPPPANLGGQLSLLGPWNDALGIPIIQLDSVVAGIAFNLAFVPPVPSKIFLGAEGCIGLKDNCDNRRTGHFIDIGAYVGLNPYVQAENFFFAYTSGFKMDTVLNIAVDLIRNIEGEEVSDLIEDFKDVIPRDILDFGILPKDPDFPGCTNDVNLTDSALGASTDGTAGFNPDCNAWIAISPLADNTIDAIDLTIQRGIGFSGKIVFGEKFEIAAEAKLDIFQQPLPSFYLDATMSQITLGNFIEIGGLYNVVRGTVEGDARFFIDISKASGSALVFIQAAVTIPFMKTYAFVDIHINREMFNFDAQLNLFDGFFNTFAHVEFLTNFSYFKADFEDLSFGGVLFINKISFLVNTAASSDNPATSGNVVAFKAEITVLFLLNINIEWSVTVNDQEKYISLFFIVEFEVPLINGTLSGNARVDWGTSESNTLQLSGSNPIESADWDLGVEINWDGWLQEVGTAVTHFFQEAFHGLTNVLNEVADVAKKAWTAVLNAANNIGGYVKQISKQIADKFSEIEDLSDAVGVFGNLLFNASKDLGTFATDFIKGFSMNLVNIVERTKVWFSSGITQTLTRLSMWFSSSGQDGPTMVWLDTRDPQWDCRQFHLVQRQCYVTIFRCGAGEFSVRHCNCCRDVNIGTFPDKTCVESKQQQIQNLRGSYGYSQGLYSCREDTLENSQGLRWAAGGNADVGLQVTPDQNINIGRLSSISSGACRPVNFDVKVGVLASNSAGITNTQSNLNFNDDCLDFSNEDTINSTLNNYMSKVAHGAVNASRGDMGRDSMEARQCASRVETQGTLNARNAHNTAHRSARMATCAFQPYATAQERTATITCNQIDDDIMQKVFDESNAIFHYDTNICDHEPTMTHFDFNMERKENNLCVDHVWTHSLYFWDCCGQISIPLEYTIIIEEIPLVITSTPGSLDTSVQCGSNIFPNLETIRLPEYDGGCQESNVYTNFTDETAFDNIKCETTVTRTYTITPSSCRDHFKTFQQEITIVHDKPPIWDNFPADVTVGVFAPYGPDATGFPEAFAPCGDSPVLIDFIDSLEEGDCLADTIIRRKFRAVDSCGKESFRDQMITIMNNADELPLGADISLHWIYAGQYMEVNKGLEPKTDCGVTSAKCGISTSDIKMKSCSDNGSLNESTSFTLFENQLVSLVQLDNLNTGYRQRRCSCSRHDMTCTADEDEYTHYGVHKVVSVGNCEDYIPFQDTNIGSQSVTIKNCFPQPKAKKKHKKQKSDITGPSSCQTLIFEGLDVYNFFEISIETIGHSNIIISAPSNSIVLINLTSESTNVLSYSKPVVVVQEHIQGIKLEGGITANRILWNAPFDYELYLPRRSDPFDFYGTFLGRQGEVRMLNGYGRTSNTWYGQLFANRINAKHLVFKCGHFIGFESCSLEESKKKKKKKKNKAKSIKKQKNKHGKDKDKD